MSTELIKFHETELYALKDEDNMPVVAVKPIADAIGLNYQSVHKRLKNDEILGGASSLRTMHDTSGRLQRMVCLPIEHIHGWLFSIDSSRVNEHIKETLILFKRECYRALYDHFYGSTRNINNNLKERHQLLEENKQLYKEVYEKTKRIKANEVRLKIIDRDNSRQLGLFVNDVPEVDNNISIDIDDPDRQN